MPRKRQFKRLKREEKFPFFLLPNELTSLILNVTEFQVAVKLFSANKAIRKHFLHHGLLPRRLDEIQLNISDNRIRVDRVTFRKSGDHGQLRFVTGSTGCLFFSYVYFTGRTFVSSEKSPSFRVCSGKDCAQTNAAVMAYSRLIVSQLRSCRTLIFYFPSASTVPKYFQMIIDRETLKNLQNVENLSINEGPGLLWDTVEESLSTKFLLQWDLPTVDRDFALWSNTHDRSPPVDYCRILAKEAFNRCKMLYLKEVADLAKVPAMRVEFYTIYHWSLRSDEFFQEIRKFLVDRAVIPEKAPTGAAVVFVEPSVYMGTPEERIAVIVALFAELPELEILWIDGKTGEEKPLNEFTPTRQCQADHLAVPTSKPKWIIHQQLEAKFIAFAEHGLYSTIPGGKEEQFYQEIKCCGYFNSKPANRLFVARICGHPDNNKYFQLQLLVQAVPKGYF